MRECLFDREEARVIASSVIHVDTVNLFDGSSSTNASYSQMATISDNALFDV